MYGFPPRITSSASLSARYRARGVMLASVTSDLESVGRIPVSTTSVPMPRATSLTPSTSSSTRPWRSLKQLPSSTRGSMFASRLYRASSVVYGPSSSGRISSAFEAGRNASFTRNISCSAPIRRIPVSKQPESSICCSARRSRRSAFVKARVASGPPGLPVTLCPTARRYSTKREMSSIGFLPMAGTVAPSAGYPTTRTRKGRSFSGLPSRPFKNFIGEGVCVSVASPA